MPSVHRILSFTAFIVFATGLAHGGERDEAAAARIARPGVGRSAKAAPQNAPHLPLPVVQSLNNLPLRFEANQGQTDRRVEFLSRGQGYTLFLAGEEAVLSLRGQNGNGKIDNPKSKIQNAPPPSVIRMKLEGARTVQAEGLDPLPTKSNYFFGSDPRQWRTNVPSYARVKYQDVYPGISLIYYGNQQQLEYDFVVAPGADPRAIRLAVEGAVAAVSNRRTAMGTSPLQVASNGDLMIATETGDVRFRKPAVYQMVDGRRREIAARYGLRAKNPKYEVAFELAAYDPKIPLVIDPVLSYSTFLGGANTETGYGIATDSTGNVYVAGTTVSVNFPTKTPFQTVSNGNTEVFITKLDATATTLVYSSYLGGSGADQVSGLTLDGSGSVLVTGTTTSPNFPTTTGALQTAFGGGTCGSELCPDAFVAKIKPDGSGLNYATYLGGTGADSAAGIALDSTGNAYITGTTNSTIFPTASPLQAALSGTSDAFLAKINPDGASLVYSTYLGGAASDFGEAVAVDFSGNAFVAGYTLSTDFPTANPLQAAKKGLSDAFITEINPTGDARVFSTYLGGTDDDRVRALAVDAAGNVYVAGETSSADFPVSASPLQAALSPGTCGAVPCPDGFLTKLDPTGTTALYSTYLGGAGFDQIFGIAVNAAEDVFVTGSTSSADFPLQNPMQAAIGGGTCPAGTCSDVFVTRLDATGSGSIYSTFLGGSDADAGQAIFVDGSDNAFVTGFVGSIDFPATPGAFQLAAGGTSSSGDAFVAKIGPADASELIIAPIKLTFADQPKGFASDALTITLKNVGTAPIAFSSIATTGDFSQTNTCEPSLAIASATCTISVKFTPLTLADLTGELTITSDTAGSPHKLALAGKGIEAKSKLIFDPAAPEIPDQNVETTSAPIPMTVSNTGFADITITKIETTGEYAQTNNCPMTPNKLVIGGSCIANVTFTPKGSGIRSGGIVVTSDAGNAGGGKNSLAFGGKGVSVFTISAPTSSVLIERGTKSTTFTINAAGPSDFTGALALACASGTLGLCTFSPASIKVGESSTLTVSNLDGVTPETFTFTVRGTNSLQFAETSLTVTFSDYSIASKPTFGTVSAGDSFVVKVTLSSKDGFDGTASFSCASLPQESSCSFSPTTVNLDGTNTPAVDVTIKTTTRVTTWAPPRPPSAPNPWLPAGVGMLAVMFVLGLRRRKVRLLLVAIVVLGMFFMASCNDYYYYTYTGTLPGTFPVTITSTVGTVSHTTGIYLTVL